jgi:hypothetical protein
MPCRSAYKIPYYHFSDSDLCPLYLVQWELYQDMRNDVFILKGSNTTVSTICAHIRFVSGSTKGYMCQWKLQNNHVTWYSLRIEEASVLHPSCVVQARHVLKFMDISYMDNSRHDLQYSRNLVAYDDHYAPGLIFMLSEIVV